MRVRKKKSSESRRGRGRPRSFDPDVALDRVLEVFWRKGFGSTSLDELAATAGLNRPNLRAAFGDKQALYVAALNHFRNAMRDALAAALRGNQPLRDELGHCFAVTIDVYTQGAPAQCGCPVYATAPAAAVELPLVRAALADTLAEQDQTLTHRLQLARQRGELPADADPVSLGIAVAALLHSMAIRARTGISSADLTRLYQGALDAILPAVERPDP